MAVVILVAIAGGAVNTEREGGDTNESLPQSPLAGLGGIEAGEEGASVVYTVGRAEGCNMQPTPRLMVSPVPRGRIIRERRVPCPDRLQLRVAHGVGSGERTGR